MKYIIKNSIILILFSVILTDFSYSQDRSEPKGSKSYLVQLEKTEKTGETKTSSGANNIYKNYQDSIFQHLLLLNVTARTMFNFNLSLSDEAWSKIINNTNDLPFQQAMKSLNAVPSIAFIPTGQERMMYQTNLENARYIPGITLPNYGLKVSFNDIGTFLGLVEDTSPEIQYYLDSPNTVEVVIYSIQAKVVATLFNGKQITGNYKLTWNFRDDLGRKMPSGDYIAEVRIGNSKFVRKRIVIP